MVQGNVPPMIQGKELKSPVEKSSMMRPTGVFSVLLALYWPAVAAKLRLTTVPMSMLALAVSENVRLLTPPAEIALKLALPLLTVMPGVVQLMVAVPFGEAAPPLLLSGMVMVTVSPGSRRPLLLPVGVMCQ